MKRMLLAGGLAAVLGFPAVAAAQSGAVVAEPPAAFWSQAPAAIHDRIDFMEGRIRRAERAGALTTEQASDAYGRLTALRRQEFDLRQRDGGVLSARDRDYLQTSLDEVGRQVRWTQRANADGYAGPREPEAVTSAPAGFAGYPEFAGREAGIRARIETGVRDHLIDPADANGLFDQLRSIQADEAGVYALHGAGLPLAEHARLDARLDQLDRRVDDARAP